VNRDECLSCLEPPENDDDDNDDGNDNNDNEDEDEIREICEELYERSAKCEENLSDDVATTKYTGACEYIHKTLPRAEKLVNGYNGGGNLNASTFMACLFFVSTMGVAAYAYYLHRKISTNNDKSSSLSFAEMYNVSKKVDLSSCDGEVSGIKIK